MYLVKEADIISWVKSNELTFINCACRFTEKNSNEEENSKRKEMKNLINHFRKINKNIDYNIFKSVENVNLDTIIGYRNDGKTYSFLDNYDKK